MNLDDAKDQVAKKHGFHSFEDLIWQKCHNIARVSQVYQDEAANLYAQQVANEAVKADRDIIFGESYFDSEIREQVVQIDVTVRPLPFPQQPDGI